MTALWLPVRRRESERSCREEPLGACISEKVNKPVRMRGDRGTWVGEDLSKTMKLAGNVELLDDVLMP